MKLLQIIKEEVVPLSGKQYLVLSIIVACVFQFILFYAPALADEAVEQAQAKDSGQDLIVRNDPIIKEGHINQETTNVNNTMSSSSSLLAASSTNLASEPSTSLVATSSPKKATSTPPKIKRTSTHTITAYNSEETQTDDSPCITANGYNVCLSGKEDTIAANFLPFGAKVKIPELFGERVFVVRDRMNKRHASRVDVWMKDYDEAIHFGVKVAKIQVLE